MAKGWLAWELRGPGVKAMAEDDFLAANGERRTLRQSQSGRAKWANNMTAKYDALALHDPIFGQLRNCMDLAVIGALIFKENLAARANCDLSGLTGSGGPAGRSVRRSQASRLAGELHQERRQLDHQRLGRSDDPFLGRGRQQGNERHAHSDSRQSQTGRRRR